jgi:hypothetical protein
MNSNEYNAVKKAAELRITGASNGAWGLADAVLYAIPRWIPDGDLASHLEKLAAALESDGVETPNGMAYTPGTLRDLRAVSLRWPHNERLDQASFRTHQEAGDRSSTVARALEGLCRLAQGQHTKIPEGISSGAWEQAAKMVHKSLARKSRYPVTANAVRVAVQRKPNIPLRDDVTPRHDPEYARRVWEQVPVEEKITLMAEAVQSSDLIASAVDEALVDRQDTLRMDEWNEEDTLERQRVTRSKNHGDQLLMKAQKIGDELLDNGHLDQLRSLKDYYVGLVESLEARSITTTEGVLE